jgi:hypothetical protein
MYYLISLYDYFSQKQQLKCSVLKAVDVISWNNGCRGAGRALKIVWSHNFQNDEKYHRRVWKKVREGN